MAKSDVNDSTELNPPRIRRFCLSQTRANSNNSGPVRQSSVKSDETNPELEKPDKADGKPRTEVKRKVEKTSKIPESPDLKKPDTPISRTPSVSSQPDRSSRIPSISHGPPTPKTPDALKHQRSVSSITSTSSSVGRSHPSDGVGLGLHTPVTEVSDDGSTTGPPSENSTPKSQTPLFRSGSGRKVYKKKSDNALSEMAKPAEEEAKSDHGLRKDESYVDVGDAKSLSGKESEAVAPVNDEKTPTTRNHIATSRQDSEMTLAEEKANMDQQIHGGTDCADVLKENLGEQNEQISRPGSERYSDSSYPELDEMAFEEVHHHQPPPQHKPYGKVRWAPWNVPAKRRLQTLVVLTHSLGIIMLCSLFFALCANPLAWPLLLIYLLHVLSSKAATDGSLAQRSEWLRSSSVWHLFAGYFPAKLHKTHHLPPTRKYIFGYHPHGIISHGAYAAFATEALAFAEKFPGITNSLLTLDSNFRIPFYRDYILAMGLRSVSKESIVNILSRGGPNNEGMGRAVTVVVGGARESLEAQPGQMRLILKERKGFIKLAVRTGADLVPVLCFGENELYDQLQPNDHPTVHKLQIFVLKVWKFTLPFLHGRGIFNYDVGLMPYRHPLNIVVGAPIKVAQSGYLDNAEIDRLHDLYVAELEKLWDRYKDEFAGDRNEELQILN